MVSGGLASAPVTLAGLTPPPLNGGTGATPVQGVMAVPDGSGGAAAVLRADGVDQAGLTLQLMPSGGGSVPASDPRYNLVYYRETSPRHWSPACTSPATSAATPGSGGMPPTAVPASPAATTWPRPAPPPGVWTR